MSHADDTQPLDPDRTEDPMDPNPRPNEDDPTNSTASNAGTTSAAGDDRTAGAPVAVDDVRDDRDRRGGMRVGTTVWGLVIAAIGLGLLASTLGYAFDVELALIALVAAAGVALLVGTVLTAARRRD